MHWIRQRRFGLGIGRLLERQGKIDIRVVEIETGSVADY
jgi:hypothetical protein